MSVWHDRISLIGNRCGKVCRFPYRIKAGVPLLGMEGMNMWDVGGESGE